MRELNIIVLIKQVPNVAEIKINPETGTLVREGVPSIINPNDRNALEEALHLKDQFGAKTTAVSMGPLQSREVLREALNMGIDEAILVSDRAFAGADTSSTSNVLGRVIEKLGKYDLVVCGLEAIDGMTAQVGPQVAELLDIPQITYVRSIEIKDNKLIATKVIEDGYQIVESSLPALIAVTRDINVPRIPPMECILDACMRDVILWNAETLGLKNEETGLKGSATRIKKTMVVQMKSAKVEMIDEKPAKAAALVVENLKKKYLL